MRHSFSRGLRLLLGTVLMMAGLNAWPTQARAQDAPICVQDGGTKMCDPAVDYYTVGYDNGHGAKYKTPQYATPLGAAQDMAQWMQATLTDCHTPYASYPTTCNYGVLLSPPSAWWDPVNDVCGGDNYCYTLTQNPDYQFPFTFPPRTLLATFAIWGYGGKVPTGWTAPYPSQRSFYTFKWVSYIYHGATCPPGDTPTVDGHTSDYYYVCVRPITALTNDQVNASALDASSSGRACSCNPVDMTTGLKTETAVDYQNTSPYPIVWARHYNIQAGGWHFGYDRSILFNQSAVVSDGTIRAQLTRDDGSTLDFAGTPTSSGSQGYNWGLAHSHYSMSKPNQVQSTLTTDVDGQGKLAHFYLHNLLDETETYNAQGRLTKITSREGHSLRFEYNSKNQLQTVSDDFGHSLSVEHLSRQQVATFTPANPAHENDPTQSPTTSSTANYWPDSAAGVAETLPTKITDGRISVSYTYAPSSANEPQPVLTQVKQSDGGVRTYTYGEKLSLTVSAGVPTVSPTATTSTQPNDLTGVIAEDGQRLETLFYENTHGEFGRVTGETLGSSLKPIRFTTQGPLDLNGHSFALVSDGYSNTVSQNIDTSPCPPTFCQGGPIGNQVILYDDTANPVSLKDFNNNVETRVNDPIRGLMLSRSEATNQSALTRTTTYTWDPRFRLPTSITVPMAVQGVAGTRTTRINYDEHGHPLNVTTTPSTGEPARTSTYTYDDAGLLSTETTPSGAVTVYAFDDATGQLEGWSDPLGHLTSLDQYTPQGNVGRITDPNGKQTLYTYDARQRITQVRRGSPSTHWETTQIVYQPSGTGLVDHLVAADGRQVAFTYNSAQWLTGTTLKDVQGRTLGSVAYTYSLMGDPTGEQWFDAQGSPIQMGTTTYDTYHRVATQVGSAAQTTTPTYDAQGRVTQVKDANGNITKRIYDALNRVISVTDALSHTATLAYDPQDALTQVTDFRGNVTRYVYNGFGELVSRTSPDSGTWTFSVDGAGRTTGVTDARGATTAVTYDLNDRPTQIVYDSTAVPQNAVSVARGTETQTFTYDACTNGMGHLCSMTDASGTTAYAYDLWGRVTSTAFTPAGQAQPLTVGYAYDDAGRLTGLTYPSGRTLTQTYGTDGQLSGLAWGGSPLLAAVTHRAVGGEVTGWQWASAAAGGVTLGYDNDSQLTQMSDTAAQGTARTLGYDPGGRLTSVSVVGNSAWNQSYGYDKADRLTSATLSGYPSMLNYAYDNNGNRTTLINGGTTVTATTALTSNRLTNLLITGGTTATLTYDANGNLTSDGQGLNLTYDSKNRLSIALSSVQTNDAYNALGQRTFKQVIGGPRAGVERYVYGPGGSLLGVYGADGTPIEETAYLDDGRPVGLARPNGSAWTTYPILTDQLGTPRQVLDPSTGTPVWTWEAKEPFGSERPNETVSGVTFTYRGRFPGQVFDEDTGLIHNGFRDYAPSVGRYVESDPIGLAGGWNTYAYTLNDPSNSTDSTGLATIGHDSSISTKEFPAFLGKYNRMRTALSKVPGIDAVFSKFDSDPSITLTLTKSTDPRYINRRIGSNINWNPAYSPKVFCRQSGQTGYISPMSVFSHEGSHPVNDYGPYTGIIPGVFWYFSGNHQERTDYENLDELHAVQVENLTEKYYGEIVRDNHKVITDAQGNFVYGLTDDPTKPYSPNRNP